MTRLRQLRLIIINFRPAHDAIKSENVAIRVSFHESWLPKSTNSSAYTMPITRYSAVTLSKTAHKMINEYLYALKLPLTSLSTSESDAAPPGLVMRLREGM